MVSFKNVAILAFAGITYAAPLAHRGDFNGPFAGRLPGTQGYNADSGKTIIVVPVNTDNNDNNTPPVVAAPVIPVPSPSAAPTPAAQPIIPIQPPAPSPSAQPVVAVPSTNTGSTSDTGYMGVVNKMRAAGGLSALTQSSKLEANALKTANDGNGQMVHELNPGSFAQVLAPGNSNNFESVYVGGWLCEIPSLPGLNGICGSAAQGWSHDGETGHADILTSKQYTQIGCALAKGIWACDLS